MPVIDYPKMCVEHMHMTDIFLVADDASVNQYCTENGYGSHTYIAENQRFSNDGSLAYQYYSGGKWILEYGFKQIVVRLTY